MGAVPNVATGSRGYSYEAESRSCASAMLVLHHTKHFVFCGLAKNEGGSTMIQNVIILVLTAPASAYLWFRSRFKLCRRCRSTRKAVGIRLPRLWCRAVVYLGSSLGIRNKTLDKIPPGPKLDALTAEKVFG
jgi:hypothetical protein